MQPHIIRQGDAHNGTWAFFTGEDGTLYIVFACPGCGKHAAHDPALVPRGLFMLDCMCGHKHPTILDGLPPATLQ